jgi:hypothetical protein
MSDRDLEQSFDLHQVKRVVEVKSHQAANKLLAAGWILHDVYVSQDWQSNYIMITMEPIVCPRCSGPADIEVNEEGDDYRYVCHRECN